MKQGKVWGETRPLLQTANIEVHALDVLPHAACSWHLHEHKCNAFYVEEGRLIVEVQQRAYDLIDRTELGPGDLTTVAPGLYHRFVTEEEPVKVLELYYAPGLNAGDIVRSGVGSRGLPAEETPPT